MCKSVCDANYCLVLVLYCLDTPLLVCLKHSFNILYCFVIWCLHTNKRRPCSSTLSGHPSSSCCVGCGAGSGTPCCFWLLRRSLRLRAAVAYCVSLTEGCILYCTHAKCPMRMPILAWLILNPEKSKHKTPSNHKVRTLI